MKYTRLKEMEEYILSRDFVSLRELCGVFGRSLNTVRRDVAELVATGAAQKVYGGVRAARPAGALLSFAARSGRRAAEKQAIGALAAPLVQDGDIIFVDSGTTTLALIPHLAGLSGVTVLTNNLHVILRCLELPALNTICFGGQLKAETASFASHYMPAGALESFNVNKAFMAATGVSIEKGATNTSPAELEIKKAMVRQSSSCTLMADTTKFGHAGLLTYAPLSAFGCVVTNAPPPPEYAEYFAAQGIRLICG